MIYLLTLTKEDSEKEMLSKAYKNIAAKISDDYWDMKFVRSIAEGREFLANEPLLDFLCVDVTLPGSVEFLSVIRKKYEKAGLLLMVDISIPPTAYLKPGIRPDAIIVKPLKEDNTDETLEEFFGTYFSE
nr:hypothetical protein [Lachnospiraceae bacterium]